MSTVLVFKVALLYPAIDKWSEIPGKTEWHYWILYWSFCFKSARQPHSELGSTTFFHWCWKWPSGLINNRLVMEVPVHFQSDDAFKYSSCRCCCTDNCADLEIRGEPCPRWWSPKVETRTRRCGWTQTVITSHLEHWTWNSFSGVDLEFSIHTWTRSGLVSILEMSE